MKLIQTDNGWLVYLNHGSLDVKPTVLPAFDQMPVILDSWKDDLGEHILIAYDLPWERIDTPLHGGAPKRSGVMIHSIYIRISKSGVEYIQDKNCPWRERPEPEPIYEYQNGNWIRIKGKK